MGVDIHMTLVRNDGEVLIKNVYDGRNREWFDNLQDTNWNNEYAHLPNESGIPKFAPTFIKEDYMGAPQNGYFGFRHMIFQDYVDWYEEYNPQLDAGWVSTYDKWRMEHKGYIPDDTYHYLPTDENVADFHFVEFEDPYDPNTNVINTVEKYLASHKEIDRYQVYLIYYFDC